MRTATLNFDHGKMFVRGGILVAQPSENAPLHLFRHPDRTLSLPFMAARPPLMDSHDDPLIPGTSYLLCLSFTTDANGMSLCAMKEHDTTRDALLFVDTYDPYETRWPGRYTVPQRHDARLPHDRYLGVKGGADYGLVVFTSGESIIVQSTGGHLVNLSLGPDDKFAVQPCTKEEHALMTDDI